MENISIGSLASFETAGGNTEGVPLLEEHEFESTTNSVSNFCCKESFLVFYSCNYLKMIIFKKVTFAHSITKLDSN